MDRLKGITKDGWHPKGKSGSGESWRSEFKGINQIAGWVGKDNKGSSSTESTESTYSEPYVRKDPSLYPPPPKRYDPKPSAEKADDVATSSGSQAQLEDDKPRPPPIPFRADKSGIDTSKFPKPPVKRNPGSSSSSPTSAATSPSSPAKLKPNLPPRLPPRTSETCPPPETSSVAKSSSNAKEGAAAKGEYLNQNSLNNLGKVGITVPGLGIGREPSTSPTLPPRETASSMDVETKPLNGLQQSFSRSHAGGLSSSTPASSASGSTTWAEKQKQAALKTASNLQKDQTTVSASDMRGAAGTVQNLYSHHDDRLTSGLQAVDRLSKSNEVTRAGAAAGKKAAPPPPPAKKASLQTAVSGGAPPPVPLASKPKT